jgi:hypothetical protein
MLPQIVIAIAVAADVSFLPVLLHPWTSLPIAIESWITYLEGYFDDGSTISLE